MKDNNEWLSPQEILDKYKKYLSKSDIEKFEKLCKEASNPLYGWTGIGAQKIDYNIKAENELKTKNNENT